ncbi:MAG: hypothetical protein ACJ73E_04440 [Mycobacteriales bacterium]
MAEFVAEWRELLTSQASGWSWLDVTGTDLVPHLAFGHGSHHGVGAALARLEPRIALGSLLTRLLTLRLAVPAEQLRWRPGMLMRRLEELPVAW